MASSAKARPTPATKAAAAQSERAVASPSPKLAPSQAQLDEAASRRKARKKREAQKMKKVVKLGNQRMEANRSLVLTMLFGSAEEKFQAVSTLIDDVSDSESESSNAGEKKKSKK
jgi:hypothetical protein